MATCRQCRAPLSDKHAPCPSCGYAPPARSGYRAPAAPPDAGLFAKLQNTVLIPSETLRPGEIAPGAAPETPAPQDAASPDLRAQYQLHHSQNATYRDIDSNDSPAHSPFWFRQNNHWNNYHAKRRTRGQTIFLFLFFPICFVILFLLFYWAGL